VEVEDLKLRLGKLELAHVSKRLELQLQAQLDKVGQLMKKLVYVSQLFCISASSNKAFLMLFSTLW
jgi:hypothetical protein